ncbi:MAG: hypothetical protein RJA10_338 [Pseudomonadota bacterium]
MSGQAPSTGARRQALTTLGSLAAVACIGPGCAQPPRPAEAAAPAAGATVDETWPDATRQRQLPVRVRWPATGSPPAGGWPVVLFSHGLGGTRAGGEAWGRAWAAAGLVVVHLQHPGSDLAAVRGSGASSFGDREALRRAASPQQLLARLQDVGFALDELTRRQAARSGRWADVRVQRVGLAGHSFGAHTTLGMAGQRYPGFAGVAEPRLAAFIALSPTVPAAGDARTAFAALTRPVLALTGTLDGDVMGNGATPERRRAVFDALPPGRKAQLVLADADHMTFAGQTGAAAEIVPRAEVTRRLQPPHHALVATLTTDWWRAWLMDDEAARQRLKQPAGLAAGDRWSTG